MTAPYSNPTPTRLPLKHGVKRKVQKSVHVYYIRPLHLCFKGHVAVVGEDWIGGIMYIYIPLRKPLGY